MSLYTQYVKREKVFCAKKSVMDVSIEILFFNPLEQCSKYLLFLEQKINV